MAATTLVRDFIWRVGQALNDVRPQFVTWAESEIVMAINDGQVCILKYIPTACTRVDAIKLAAGRALQSIDKILAVNCVPADGSTPPAVINGRQLMHLDCNMTANGTAEGRAVSIVDRYDLDATDPDWQTRSAATVRQYVYNSAIAKNFYVTPVPSTATQWVRAVYTAYPQTVAAGGAPGAELYAFAGSNAALLSVDDANVDDLFYYVTARLSMKQSAKATQAYISFATNAFVSSVNAQVLALTGINPNLKHLPMMPGDNSGAPINADRT